MRDYCRVSLRGYFYEGYYQVSIRDYYRGFWNFKIQAYYRGPLSYNYNKVLGYVIL